MSTTSNNVNDVNFMKRLFSFLSKIKIQWTFGAVAMDASSFALRISWLKFEPKVSNFPVIETDATVSITNATIKVRCIFIFCTDKSL